MTDSRAFYHYVTTGLPILAFAMLTAACTPELDSEVLHPEASESPTSPPTAAPARITITPSPSATPTSTRSPFPTPVPLPTLVVPIDLDLPAVTTLDEFRIAMWSGSEEELKIMTDLPRYRISMRLDDLSGVLEGREEIVFTNRTGVHLQAILLRLYPNYSALLGSFDHSMRIGDVTVQDEAAKSEYAASNTGLLIHLPQPLSPGEAAVVGLGYSMLLKASDEGVWRLNYAYPMLAVHDGREWREDLSTNGDLVFSESAMYSIEVTIPSRMTIAASGVETSRRRNSDDTVTTVLLAPAVRDATMVISSTLRRESVNHDDMRISLWHLPGDPLVDAKLDTIVGAMSAFNEMIGHYPFSEFDVVALFDPEWAFPSGSGMEYSGLVYYLHGVEEWQYSLVHEVAHQWWYGVVGNDTQLEPWLDEAMAEYITYLYFLETRGEQEARLAFEANVTADYIAGLDSGRIDGTELVGSSVYDFAPFDATYSWIVYGKGALFLDELRRRVGPDQFLPFLQEYYRRFKYDVATGEGFLEIAEEITGLDVGWLYEAWVKVE